MTLEEEVRNGYTIPARMKRVWKVQMDLLEKLFEVCDKYGLKIWADGGTLLGTVREHGYIPWDDDIDMAMLREDYDKLIQVAPKEFDHPFFFQCGYTEKVYPLGFSKLRMDGTSAIEPSPVFRNLHQGIFIDIFPYDAIPDDEEAAERLFRKRNRLIYKMRLIKTFDILHPLKSQLLFGYRFFFHKVYKRFEDLMRSSASDDCRNVSCISFIMDTEHFLRDKHWYDETVWMPFEDIQMPVPVGYNQILTKQYGDYLVPRQAGSYHTFWRLDPDKPFTEYIPELKEFYKKTLHERRLFRIKKFLRKACGFSSSSA